MRFKKMTIVLSNVCNLRCKDCYTTADVVNKEVLSDEGIEIIKGMMRKYGPVKHLIISGGEPTLHLEKTCSLIQGLALNTKVMTNGWWTQNLKNRQRVLDAFEKADLITLQISCGVEHQKGVSIESVVDGIDEALSRKKVQEAVVSYELNDRSQKFQIPDNFGWLAAKHDNFRVVTGYWNEMGEDSMRVDGRAASFNDQQSWCDALDTSVVSIRHDGDIYRCCGGLIMKDRSFYKVGNIFDQYAAPYSKDDPYKEIFQRIQVEGRKLDRIKSEVSHKYSLGQETF